MFSWKKILPGIKNVSPFAALAFFFLFCECSDRSSEGIFCFFIYYVLILSGLSLNFKVLSLDYLLFVALWRLAQVGAFLGCF